MLVIFSIWVQNWCIFHLFFGKIHLNSCHFLTPLQKTRWTILTYNKGSWDLWYVCRRTLRVCWEIFWLILLKITQLWLLVAGKYFTPCRVSAQQFQCFRLRVMPYIHPSWPPTERSSLSHSAFALLNSKGFFFHYYYYYFLSGKQREV